MISFKGKHSEREIILTCIRWYLAYALSYRDLEEIMLERGVNVDHTTIYRWVFEYSALLEDEFKKRKKPVGSSWRMDETYIKVKGEWYYLYRAVDKEGNTIDFLLRQLATIIYPPCLFFGPSAKHKKTHIQRVCEPFRAFLTNQNPAQFGYINYCELPNQNKK